MELAHRETRPYRPANGFEGAAFQETYCVRCKLDVNESCEIWLRANIFMEDEAEYPEELVQPLAGGAPFCTAFDQIGAPVPVVPRSGRILTKRCPTCDATMTLCHDPETGRYVWYDRVGHCGEEIEAGTDVVLLAYGAPTLPGFDR